MADADEFLERTKIAVLDLERVLMTDGVTGDECCGPTPWLGTRDRGLA